MFENSRLALHDLPMATLVRADAADKMGFDDFP